MAKARKKNYDFGDRIQVYLSKDLTPEFLEWINKQSDLSGFFLYAAQQLYGKTGFIDVVKILPRYIDFDITAKSTPENKNTIEPPVEVAKEVIIKDSPSENVIKEENKDTTWNDFDLDNEDPFA